MGEDQTGDTIVTAGMTGGHVLRRLAGRNLLFSEKQQAVYELDELSAYVWCALQEGLSRTSMVDELAGDGAEQHVAEEAVGECMKRLHCILTA